MTLPALTLAFKMPGPSPILTTSVTGPLPTFMAMIKQPAYSILLNHQYHEIKLLERRTSIAVFAIKVTANDRLAYL